MSLSHDTLKALHEAGIERTPESETVLGFKVTAYREPHPEHGTKYGHRYSEHWSTPNYNLPVERLFTEAQLRSLIAERDAMRGGWQPIETAPKDGEVLLYCAETGEQFVAFLGTNPEDGEQQWVFARSPNISFIVRDPTHWMPLPGAPALAATSEGSAP